MKKVFTVLIALCLAAVLLPQPTAAQAADTAHQFTLVTDIADVLSGGQFVIVSVYGSAYSGAMGTTITPRTDFSYMNEIKPVRVTINNFGKVFDDDSEVDPVAFTTATDKSDVTVSGNNLPIWTIAPTGNGVSLYANGSYLAYDYTATASPTPYSWSVIPGEDNGFVFSSNGWILCYTYSNRDSYGVVANGNITPGIHVRDMLLFKLQGEHTYTSKVTPPTCTKNGYTTYTCTICGDSYVAEEVPALGHHDVDGACTRCGRTVTAPTLIGTSFTLSFENEILLNFYYTAENTQDVTEQGMLVFYSDPGEADFAKANDVYTGSVLSNDTFANTTKGIAAKEMGDERYYCAYAKLTDGSYAYSPLYSYSPEKYAIGRIQNSSNEELKALCVAMLNYGAAAQEFFGYRTDDLMNAGLTEAQQALVANYDAALFAGAVPANPDKSGAFAATDTGFTKRSATVSFEGAFVINYYFTPEFAVADSMKLYIWNSEVYESAQTLTADNAAVQVMTEQNGSWFASVRGIAPKDLDKTFYVAGVYTDGDGNTHCTGVIAYSLSRYCMNNAKPGKPMQQLAASTAMYGYYADNYFA